MTLISEVGGLLADLYITFKAAVDLYLDKKSLYCLISSSDIFFKKSSFNQVTCHVGQSSLA